MNPKVKKRKPEGTRITLGGRNKAEKKTSRNKPASNGESRRSVRVNTRRSDKAIRKGNVKEVTSTKVVSPASTRIVTPASSKTVKGTKFVSNEVRAGDSDTFGKERGKGKPTPNANLG